jgi:glucose-1-phosphate thymidylyltransferase
MAMQKRQGVQICCPEEIAFRKGFISKKQLETIAESLRNSDYGNYLQNLVNE